MAYPLPVIMLGLALIVGVSGTISPLNGRLLPAALIAAIFSLSMVGRALSGRHPCSVPWGRFGMAYLTGCGSGYVKTNLFASH